MTGVSVFAGKEMKEILRTWRIWVLPGIVLFFAVTGPLLARFTPEIVGAVVGNQVTEIKLPPPTYLDSYGQWIKNLSQIGMVALVIVYGSLVSGETRSGTAVLVLTKPLSRDSFIVSKAAVHSGFVVVLTALGAVVTWVLTFVAFGSAPGAALWRATGEFLVLAVLFLGLMTLLSVLIGSTAGAAGAGLGAYVALSVASIWQPLSDHSPAGLITQPASVAAGKDVAALWPIVTGLVLTCVLILLAGVAFRRKDL